MLKQQQVAEIAQYVLRNFDATSAAKRRNADQIWSQSRELDLKFDGERATFGAYLSNLAQDSASPIASTGRGRGGGYYLSELAARVAADEGSQGAVLSERPSATQGEKALYPVIREWFAVQGYQARVTGAMRALGKWGNPDITAISTTEHLGRLELEIATVEAKVSLSQWEYWFFEAVSHRRFANRAYFAFPLPEELSDKLPADLRYMCELYRVGALVIIVPDDQYKLLLEGTLKEELSLENVGVQEVYSAPWNHVPLTYQRQFCNALEVTDLASLFTWGGV